MTGRQLILASFLFVSLPTALARADSARDRSLALSLKPVENRGERMIEILVKNVSRKAIEIVSEGDAPHWSVSLWFRWQVDGQDARYSEHIAGWPTKESWVIPPGGVVLWGRVPLGAIESKTQAKYESAIRDSRRHRLTVLPSERWTDLKVAPDTIEIGDDRGPTAAVPPRVEMDYNILHEGDRRGKTFAELIPPEKLRHIAAVKSHEDGVRRDEAYYNVLFAGLFKSKAKAEEPGMLATEAVASTFVLTNRDGELAYVQVLVDGLTEKREVTAWLLWGKGYGCRFTITPGEKYRR